MKNIESRRTVLKGAAAASVVALLPLRSQAAEFTYKYANNMSATHPMNIRAREAVARIREQTGGRVEIKIFPDSQLGGDTDMLSQLRSGGIEFFTVSGLILSNLVPLTSLYGLAFTMKDYGVAWASMDGDLGDYMRKAIDKAGIYSFSKNWDNGYRQILSGSKQIKAPEDLNGFKIRVPISPLWTSTFKAFGAAPVSINWAETYSALQTKVVDGVENSLANIELAKIYEVQKYCSMTNYMWDNFFFLANRKAFDRLPAQLRDIVERNFNAAALDQRADVAKLNSSLRAQLTSHGMVFNDPDPEPFKAALRKAGYYAEWRDKYGQEAWARLEKYAGKLA